MSNVVNFYIQMLFNKVLWHIGLLFLYLVNNDFYIVPRLMKNLTAFTADLSVSLGWKGGELWSVKWNSILFIQFN